MSIVDNLGKTVDKPEILVDKNPKTVDNSLVPNISQRQNFLTY
jgi:hypothetical protein